MGDSTQSSALNTSGSWCCSQSSFGAVSPAMGKLPVTSAKPDPSRSASATARESSHRIAGYSTRSSAPNNTAPCICPDKPMHATRANAGCTRNCASACKHACHQSSGACSDQPLWRRTTPKRTPALASTAPSVSIRIALSSEVPRSMPRETGWFIRGSFQSSTAT